MAGSAGRYNNLAVDDQGRLHTWGYDGCGSPGGQLPERELMWKPRVVGGELEGKRVVAFDSGERAGRRWQWRWRCWWSAAALRPGDAAPGPAPGTRRWCSRALQAPVQPPASRRRRLRPRPGWATHARACAARACARPGYVLWVAATSDGELYTCNTQDDGYAGTLESKRKPNDAKELGREGEPNVPGQVGARWRLGAGGCACCCWCGCCCRTCCC
jgi:hypothetical protein